MDKFKKSKLVEKEKSEEDTEEFKREQLVLAWRYRQIIDEALNIKEKCDPGQESLERISRVMDEADELISKVKTAEKAVLDAKVMNISSDVLKQNAEAFDTNLFSYNPKVFAEKVLLHLQNEGRPRGINWRKLNSVAKKCFKYRTPPLEYMYGALQIDVALPEKKPRKSRDKQVEGNKRVPENINKADEEMDELSMTISHVLKTLEDIWRSNGNRPISYFELVINPDSFGATVENIFHVAFLVKDGVVDYQMDDEGFPVIAHVPKATVQQRKAGDADFEKQQMIVSISMAQWEDLKDAFEIETPMIKPYTKPARTEKPKKRQASSKSS